MRCHNNLLGTGKASHDRIKDHSNGGLSLQSTPDLKVELILQPNPVKVNKKSYYTGLIPD